MATVQLQRGDAIDYTPVAATAAGTVVTENVPEGSLAIGRERQENKEGYDERKREDGGDR